MWENIWEYIYSFFTDTEWLSSAIRIVCYALGGTILGRIFSRIARRAMLRRKKEKQAAQIAGKLIYYGFLVLAMFFILDELNVDVATIVTAAGIATVAISFAAQKSLSNVISGIFLYIERPFQVDDVIDVAGQCGVILSIDLLSTKIRTFDNLYIRIPNETVLSEPVINYTKFDIRRIEALVEVEYPADPQRVKAILMDMLERETLVLAEPKPEIILKELGASGQIYQVMAWILRDNFFSATSSLNEGIKLSLEEAGVEIVYPIQVIRFTPEMEEAIARGKAKRG